MTNKEVLPTLFGLASNGKLKEWSVRAEEGEDNTGIIVTVHGYVDGKLQEDHKTAHPKNVGRKNETTGFEQAVSQAKSAWNKKRDKQYMENQEDLLNKPKIPLPMLAHKYDADKKCPSFPCYVQPKLNGIRCLATKISDTEIEYTSRGGKYFKTLEHLTEELCSILEVGETIDGELFSKNLEFEEITSIVRNEKTDTGRDSLEYHVYDFPVSNHIDADAGFKDRSDQLKQALLLMDTYYIKLVHTRKVVDEEGVQKFHGLCNKNGYEGTIIRNAEGAYKFKNRSADLLKYKDFHDAEYEVIGGREGEGRFEGQVIFTCSCPGNKAPHDQFEVVPKGTTEHRRSLFENLEECIGKHLTVRYQALSHYGVPLFPVGLSFREEGV